MYEGTKQKNKKNSQVLGAGLLNVCGYAWNLWVCTYVIGAWYSLYLHPKP
jgi:hypothetical protein